MALGQCFAMACCGGSERCVSCMWPASRVDRPAAHLAEALDDAGVDVEQVVAGHARLAGHACGDDHQVAVLQRHRQLVSAGVAGDLNTGGGEVVRQKLGAARRVERRATERASCRVPFRGGRRSQGASRSRTWAGVLQWERSAATPGVLAISYSASWLTSGFIFSSRLSGWPMPPAAPSTATCMRVEVSVRPNAPQPACRRRQTATQLSGRPL